MKNSTRRLWSKQDQHEGDRQRLFTAIGDVVEATSVLYPGSFVDLAPSFVFDEVTYVDTDDRAAEFFADETGIRELIGEHRSDGVDPQVRFLHADYRHDLGLQPGSFDLLVSLYAGFVSEACTEQLHVGGTLLVNPSHGDAAMASLDRRYELSGVVRSGSAGYRIDHTDLGSYLVPKKEQEITVDSIRAAGRGIGYTKSPFAYLFERIG